MLFSSDYLYMILVVDVDFVINCIVIKMRMLYFNFFFGFEIAREVRDIQTVSVEL